MALSITTQTVTEEGAPLQFGRVYNPTNGVLTIPEGGGDVVYSGTLAGLDDEDTSKTWVAGTDYEITMIAGNQIFARSTDGDVEVKFETTDA